MNKAYLRKLDKKFERLFKGSGKFGAALTNTSKSVYSFEGEVLSEDDNEYNTDSSFDDGKDVKSRIGMDQLGVVGELEQFQGFHEMVFERPDDNDHPIS